MSLMNQKIVLFDWDDTLFSKVEYKKNLRSNLARICEVPEEEIFEFEEKYFDSLINSGDFQIDDFVKSFSQKFGKKIELEDFDSDKLGIYSNALFPESISILNNLKDNFRLGIYSQGFDSLQRIKIKSSEIESFFDEQLIYINRNKLDSNFIDTLSEGAIIIDDKKEVIEKLKSTGRFQLFWINRNTDEKIEDVTMIRNLDELINLI
jgi:phosphoglycolate phosphatase-like HAD superfamily hydrolase